MDEAEGAFRNADPKGLLRVNVQGMVARHFVMPRLPDFLQRYPKIALHIGEDDRLVDLVKEGIDCVLRGGTLLDSSMVARRLALLEQVTCASPDYLARNGTPRAVSDLDGHRAVHYVSSATGKPYPLQFMTEESMQQCSPPGGITVTGADMYTAAALAGLGLVQVPRYRIAGELQADRLRIVLPELPPPALPLSVLYPHNR